MDKMLAIVTGQWRPPSIPGEPDRITKPLPGGGTFQQRSTKKAVHQANFADDERVSYGAAPVSQNTYASQYQSDKYAEVTDLLDKFSFSQDGERRAKQMQVIASAVKSVLPELIVKEVAANTKTAFFKYAEKFLKAPGGITTIFNFGGDRLSVTAKGSFYGDETICVNKDGNDEIVAMVMRINGGSTEDVSDQFDIQMRKVEE